MPSSTRSSNAAFTVQRAVKGAVEDAVAERASGGRPGRMRSLVAAMAIGFAAGLLAYHLLRDEN